MQTSPTLPLRFYLEVGLMESQSVQIDTNRQMRDTLSSKGYNVGFHEFDGGHSFLTWSDGLARGLMDLLPKATLGSRSASPKAAEMQP